MITSSDGPVGRQANRRARNVICQEWLNRKRLAPHFYYPLGFKLDHPQHHDVGKLILI